MLFKFIRGDREMIEALRDAPLFRGRFPIQLTFGQAGGEGSRDLNVLVGLRCDGTQEVRRIKE